MAGGGGPGVAAEERRAVDPRKQSRKQRKRWEEVMTVVDGQYL